MSLDSFNHKKDEEMRESYETTLKDNKNPARLQQHVCKALRGGCDKVGSGV